MPLQYPAYDYPYVYPERPNMDLMGLGNLEEMKQMMMEHIETTKQIKQKVDMMEEQLRQIKAQMNRYNTYW